MRIFYNLTSSPYVSEGSSPSTMNSSYLRRFVPALLFSLCTIPATASITLSEGPLQRWMSLPSVTRPTSALAPYRLLPVPPLAGTSYRSEQGLHSPSRSTTPFRAIISRDFELLDLYQQTESYARQLHQQDSNPWLLNDLLSTLIQFGGRFIAANFTHS